MFKNYFKIAYRSIIKDKYYSIINFLGLTIGLSFFGLMLLALNHEFSYDTSYTDSDSIYRTILTSQRDDLQSRSAQLPLPFSDAIQDQVPGIEAITKVYGAPQQVIQTDYARGRLDDIVATDSAFFSIFDLDFIFGQRATALDNQMSIVLTQETANRFFGDQNPIGEVMEIEAYGLFTVTGVLDKIPENSSFRFSAIMNPNIDRYLEGFTERQWFIDYYTSWRGRIAHSYIKLKEDTDPVQIASQIDQIAVNYFGQSDITRTFDLQPVTDIHFHSAEINSNLSELNGTPGNIQYVYIFAAIAILILSIACINYMNLSSARSIKRTAEVGLRSVLGAYKSQLIIQFLTQSVIMAALSIVPAILLLNLIIPYYESITSTQLVLNSYNLIRVGIFAVPSIFFIGLISGLYPALMLSRLELSQAIKQKTSSSVQSSFFRKGLVIGQFALTYSIIVLTILAGRQLNYVFDKELGFDEEHVVVMEIDDGRLRNFVTDLKTEVTKDENVVGIAGLTRMFSGYRDPATIEINREGNSGENLPLQFYGFDEDVIEVMDLEIVQGRNFLAEGGETLNPTTILINEVAADMLFPGEPAINKVINLGNEQQLEATIVGVVKDFHFQSLHVPIEPLIIGYINNPFVGIDDFAIRITGNNIPETIAHIEQVVGQFIELDEDQGLEYQFLDSMINSYYKTDTVYRKLFMIGASITIILAVVGLVGLTSFYAEMRTKEFGIRKVLGASLKDLVSIQSSFFLKLIAIAISIGIPASALVSTKWLQNFSYKVNLDVTLFILACIGTVLIALIPIGLIALKTSLQNPITQLRSE